MTRPRILCVDDCIDTLDLLKGALEGEFDVYLTDKPAMFADAFSITEPDLVILDIMMPGISGLQLLARASVPGGPVGSVPFIVLSARHEQEDYRQAYTSGARLFLHKPFEPDRLIRNLRMFFVGFDPDHRVRHYPQQEAYALLKLRGIPPRTALAQALDALPHRVPAPAKPDVPRFRSREPRWLD